MTIRIAGVGYLLHRGDPSIGSREWKLREAASGAGRSRAERVQVRINEQDVVAVVPDVIDRDVRALSDGVLDFEIPFDEFWVVGFACDIKQRRQRRARCSRC